MGGVHSKCQGRNGLETTELLTLGLCPLYTSIPQQLGTNIQPPQCQLVPMCSVCPQF